jgi:hypothetical protein
VELNLGFRLLVYGGVIGWLILAIFLLRKPTMTKKVFSGVLAGWWSLMIFLGMFITIPFSTSLLIIGVFVVVVKFGIFYTFLFLSFERWRKRIGRIR